MKYTLILPDQQGISAGPDAVGVVAAWHKEVGEYVLTGETVAVVGEAEIVSPVSGILVRQYAGEGQAIEVGEPLALLSGVPEPLVEGREALSAAQMRAVPYPPDPPGGQEEAVALTEREQALAHHMVRSAQQAPRVATVALVDMSEVARLGARAGLPPLPFVLRAVASALTLFPALNAELIHPSEIRRKRAIHLAVRCRGEDGELFAPVLRDADRKSLLSLARELEDFRQAMDGGRLPPGVQRGATFTVAEAPGVAFQTPVLAYPQAALLSVGAILREPVALPDDTLAVRPVARLCLVHDARLVGDELACAFLARVRLELEEARFLFD